MLESQLLALGIDGKWLEPLLETFDKYDINTTKRQACFLGQAMHESGGLKQLTENLNYSAKGLMQTWPSRFPDMDTAEKYERNPIKIAGKVYAGRMGNTSEEEAQKYIGRGIFQLTGKENYANCGLGLGVDLLGNPDWLATPKYAALSAGWYWNKRNLNPLADAMDIEGLTKKINGGLIGIADRQEKINKVMNILGVEKA
jgi:putative chitinase